MASDGARFALSADGLKVIAAVNDGYLYRSVDGGQSWGERKHVRKWSALAISGSGTMAVAVVNGGYICTSFDGGDTWVQRGAVGNWQAVALSANGNRMMAAGDSLTVSRGPVP